MSAKACPPHPVPTIPQRLRPWRQRRPRQVQGVVAEDVSEPIIPSTAIIHQGQSRARLLQFWPPPSQVKRPSRAKMAISTLNHTETILGQFIGSVFFTDACVVCRAVRKWGAQASYIARIDEPLVTKSTNVNRPGSFGYGAVHE